LDENGTALFSVPLLAAGGGIKDSITVKVAGSRADQIHQLEANGTGA